MSDMEYVQQASMKVEEAEQAQAPVSFVLDRLGEALESLMVDVAGFESRLGLVLAPVDSVPADPTTKIESRPFRVVDRLNAAVSQADRIHDRLLVLKGRLEV